MTYLPDITKYQQLVYGGATGNVDCTSWSAAILVDAHSQGAMKTTGRAIRLHTDEPVPDPRSPGLNLPQVDEAVLAVTANRINLDTLVGSRSLSRAEVQARIIDGRWATIQVNRGVLVNRGFLDGFRGGHAFTVHAVDGVPVIGDPLTPHYVRASWDAIFDAAEALTGGRIYSQFTRDLTPDYHWVCKPVPPATVRGFYRYLLDANGRITHPLEKHYTRGRDLRCSPPKWHGSTGRFPGRMLVQITAPNSQKNGWFVNAGLAKEIIP